MLNRAILSQLSNAQHSTTLVPVCSDQCMRGYENHTFPYQFCEFPQRYLKGADGIISELQYGKCRGSGAGFSPIEGD